MATKKSGSLRMEFTKGIIRENPVLRLVLGCCATLAVTTAAGNAIGMGAATTFVLVCSNAAISLLRNVIPGKVRIPAFITIIAGFVTIVQLFIKAFSPALDTALGVFLPLIVVNCIILGRAEMFASKKQGASLHSGRPRHGRGLYRRHAVHGDDPGAFGRRYSIWHSHSFPFHGARDHFSSAPRRLLCVWHAGGAGRKAFQRGKSSGGSGLRRLPSGRLLLKAHGKGNLYEKYGKLGGG